MKNSLLPRLCRFFDSPGSNSGRHGANLSLSFCIITNGKRPEALRNLLSSILRQNVPQFEIIISGNWRPDGALIYAPCEDAAASGHLGRMRNLAVARARFDNVVVLDDDMLLAPAWYQALCAYRRPFDILTSQIRLPDGGRYWDHATIGGPRGHVILADGECDENVYMTGGGAWVMRRQVADSVVWDESRAFYEGEDVDFSRRCQREGFQISHCHEMIVFHDDASYTTVGRRVLRRTDGRTQHWAQSVIRQLSASAVLCQVQLLRREGREAEAADLLRLAMARHFWNVTIRRKWWNMVKDSGGRLPGGAWYPDGDPIYVDAVRELSRT
jgi:hypothetical protein